MGQSWVIWLVLVSVVRLTSSTKYVLTQNEDEIIIGVGQTQILRHSSASPMLYIGRGYTTFSEIHGNFKIEDSVSERLPLHSVSVSGDDDSKTLTLSSGDKQMSLKLSSDETHQLIMEFGALPDGYERLWIRIPADSQELVYGAGEQFSSFNLRGQSYPIWTREQGCGRDAKSPLKALLDVVAGGAGGDYHTTYFPQPSFVSSRHYSCHVTGYNYVNLDFSYPNFHEIYMLGAPPGIRFNVRETMMDVTRDLTSYLGRQVPLPEWMHDGTILGVQGGTQKMLEILKQAEDNGVKVNALWIQDWSGKIVTSFGKRVYWDWIWNSEWYPNLDREIVRLKEKGVRLLAYITSHLNSDGRLFKEAEERGFFMKDQSGKTYLQDYMEFYCGTVDLTNPEAYNWYKGIITRNLIEFGFGGWMADFGEYIPADAVFYNGLTGREMHNQFTVLWARANREAVEEAGRLGDVMFYMRSGAAGTQKYSTLMWAGDQNVDWTYSDGLASTVPAALSLAMSGIGLTHFDIGGYTGFLVPPQMFGSVTAAINLTRSEELFFRYAEYAVFTPVMRTHEGNLPQFNYQVYNSETSLQRYATLVQQYLALKPYRQAVEQEMAQEGIPMQRPLFLHYDTDRRTYSLQYQYLFGADVLVAPVLDPGVDSWNVYLPDGRWRHMLTQAAYEGPDWVLVEAPLGRPPVFYKEDSKWKDVFANVGKLYHYEVPQGQCDREGGCS